MSKTTKTTILVSKTKETRIAKGNGKMSVSVKETQVTAIVQEAIKTKSKCYMLSFNKPDKRKCDIDNIIADLLKNGYLYEGKLNLVLKQSMLFLSSYNLNPIQKFLHREFPDLKFVLVRLNRRSFPSLKYCY